MTRLYPFYRIVLPAFFVILYLVPSAWAQDLKDQLSPAFKAIEPKVIKWRRDIHQHPELSNREFRTAKLVAEHLRNLGMEVQTGVAHTGVVGTLRGGKPGPVVALRADMDALPVTEMTDVPFASKVRTSYNGQEVGVMHACGHDAHTAMLMGTAEILAGVKEELPGIIKFIFEPAEEGAPTGEEGGAKLMIKEGVLDEPDAPEVIFALHVGAADKGMIFYRFGEMCAAYDSLHITVQGRQTHGAYPWDGVDPIRVSGQIITALLEMIPSQQTGIDVQAVVSIGSIHGGVRENIIPGEVEMKGTIRTFERDMRENLLARIQRTVEQIAERAGAKAIVRIKNDAPVTYNDPELTCRMLPSLRWAAGGAQKVVVMPRDTGSESFAFFQEKIPGMYFYLGVNKDGVRYGEASPSHSPYFYVNEDTLIVGVRTLAGLTIDYLNGKAPTQGFIWTSIKEGVAKEGVFKRTTPPNFQLEYPFCSEKSRKSAPGQVLKMTTPTGATFAASVGDIPEGIGLEDFGKNYYAPALQNFGSNIQVISNNKISLKCGTTAYRTDIEWLWNNSIKITSLVVSAYKDGKFVFVAAHASQNIEEITQIVESLQLK